MRSIARQGHRLSGYLVMGTPFLLIAFLGTQLAIQQVSRQFDTYQAVPEIADLATLTRLPATRLVLLRGRISPASCEVSSCDNDPYTDDLILYREGPAEGREVRFRESFGQHFTSFVLDLPDGAVRILPSLTKAHVIQEAPQTEIHGDRQRDGFRLGDVVTVQGQWQPTPAQPPTLTEVTGVSRRDKSALLRDWQNAFRRVRWSSLVTGLLAGLGGLILITRAIRQRDSRAQKETQTWHLQTNMNPTRILRT